MHPVWKIISLATGGLVTLRLRPTRKTLYITFDDGPHPVHTLRLISLLKQHDAHATFFLVCSNIERQQDLVRALVHAGHRLGNHSYSHRKLTTLSIAEMVRELSMSEQALASADGQNNHLFRPPWGRITLLQLLSCINNRRRVALWSRDSRDYQTSAEEVVKAFQDKPPTSGDVLLFHDDGPVAYEALSRLVPGWKLAGFALEVMP